MKNIERFNLYTAYIFGKLYEDFPVHREVQPAEVVAVLKLPPPEKLAKNHDAAGTEANFVAHTLRWLVETGYLILRETATGRDTYWLQRRSKLLNATLSALEGKKAKEHEKSVGERLSEVATEAGKDLAKETWTKLASEIVGGVIGHAAKAFSTG
jgi:hypothetical protein